MISQRTAARVYAHFGPYEDTKGSLKRIIVKIAKLFRGALEVALLLAVGVVVLDPFVIAFATLFFLLNWVCKET